MKSETARGRNFCTIQEHPWPNSLSRCCAGINYDEGCTYLRDGGGNASSHVSVVLDKSLETFSLIYPTYTGDLYPVISIQITSGRLLYCVRLNEALMMHEASANLLYVSWYKLGLASDQSSQGNAATPISTQPSTAV